MVKRTGVTVEFNREDKEKIKLMCDRLSIEYGFKVGQRIGVMIAVNKMMEGLSDV